MCQFAGCKNPPDEGNDLETVSTDGTKTVMKLCRRCFRHVQTLFDQSQKSYSMEGQRIKEEPGIAVVNTRGAHKIEFFDKD